MRAPLLALAALAVCVSLPSPSQAGWTEFWHNVAIDFHRNNCWPEPFIHADRADANAPFAAMIAKGWQLQNTLGAEHFDPQTNQLTRAAELKVEHILTQNAPDRRTVFVLRSLDQDITSARIDSVQQSIARMLPAGSMPAVAQTNNAPVGTSADYVFAVHSKAESSIPAPRLPAAAGDSGN